MNLYGEKKYELSNVLKLPEILAYQKYWVLFARTQYNILRTELQYLLISSATNTGPHALNSYALTVLIVRAWGREDW